MAQKELRINENIRVREVRLVDHEGVQRGVVSTSEALAIAQEQGLDLVEVAPQANPPACKILNYGKYKFELEKRKREAKKNQKIVKLKEVRMQPKIEKHDLDFKTKHVKKFLEEGNKVKVTVRFRGRELAHTELGKVVLDKVLELLGEDVYIMDKRAAMEGRTMSMIISPRVKK